MEVHLFALVVDADADSLPFLDMDRRSQEVLYLRHALPVVVHGQRVVPGGVLDIAGVRSCLLAAAEGHGRAGRHIPGQFLDRGFHLPDEVLGGELHPPPGPVSGARADRDGFPPGQRVEAHAGRVFVHDRSVLPAALAEGQHHCRVRDALPVVRHGHHAVAAGYVDPGGPGPAGVLQQFVQHLPGGRVEEPRHPADCVLVHGGPYGPGYCCRVHIPVSLPPSSSGTGRPAGFSLQTGGLSRTMPYPKLRCLPMPLASMNWKDSGFPISISPRTTTSGPITARSGGAFAARLCS